MNKLLLYSVLVALAQGAGCKVKDPVPLTNPVDQLPPATQTGDRTFGCLVNGRVWRITGNPFNGPSFTAYYTSRHIRLYASGATFSDGVATGGPMQFDIDGIDAAGRYILSRKDTSAVQYEVVQPACRYHTDTAHPATVDITRFDPVNRIVAGRFFFTLDTPGCEPLVVTEGRFDTQF